MPGKSFIGKKSDRYRESQPNTVIKAEFNFHYMYHRVTPVNNHSNASKHGLLALPLPC